MRLARSCRRRSEGSHGFVVGRPTSPAAAVSEPFLRGRHRRPAHLLPQTPAQDDPHPRRRAKAVFRFGSNEPGVTFICRVDGGLLRASAARGWCAASASAATSLRVNARDAAGNVDRTPAVFRFKVKRLG